MLRCPGLGFRVGVSSQVLSAWRRSIMSLAGITAFEGGEWV